MGVGFETVMESQEIRLEGEHVIVPVCVQLRGRSSGAEVEISGTYVFTFAGSSVVRVREYRTKAGALDALGLAA